MIGITEKKNNIILISVFVLVSIIIGVLSANSVKMLIFGLLLLSVTILFIKFVKNYYPYFSILVLFFATEFFMDPVPTEINVVNVLFALMTFAIIISVIVNIQDISLKDPAILVLLAIIFFYCCLLIVAVLFKQIPIVDSIRAIIPFCFVLIFFPLYLFLKKGYLNEEKVLFSFVLWGILYSINNLYLFIHNALEGMTLYRRITLLDPNTNSPLPLFVAIISFKIIFDKKKIIFKKMYPWYFIFILSVLGIIVTQTRSMIISLLITMVLIALYYLLQKRWTKLFKIFKLSAFVSFVFSIFLFTSESLSNLFNSILLRFSRFATGDDNVSDRIDEYISAYRLFSENPLFGGGLGIRFSAHDGVIVNYIHNSFLYFLANTGLLGITVIGVFILLTLYWAFKSKNEMIITFAFGLIGILVFSLFFATFKWFSQNMIIGIVLGCSLFLYKKSNKRSVQNVKK